MRATADYNLGKLHTALAKEWHPAKNSQLSPYDVAPMSHLKAWWICSRGHEWEATVYSRSAGNSCPYCASRKVAKDASLAIRYPELIREWHPIKNGNLTPYDVPPNSHKTVWWICSRNHEWKATVANRSRGTCCPECHPQTSGIELRIYCEFKSIFKNVRWREKIDETECDIYLPEYKVGLEIDGYPWHNRHEERDKQKGDLLSEKGISLFRLRDIRLKPTAPTDTFYSSYETHISILGRLLRSLTMCIYFSEDDKAKISDYLQSNQLLNVQEYRKMISLLPGPIPEKSLAHLFPKLAEEWNFERNKPLQPSMFTPKSHVKVWWKCIKGHDWNATVDHRTGGRGCPKCHHEKLGNINRMMATKNGKTLADKNPSLAGEWHPTKNVVLSPFDVSPMSGKKVWWICNKGHEWEATVSNRTYNRRGCPYCAGQRVARDNNLAVRYPEIAKLWHPTRNGKLTPYEVMPGSRRKVWWICNYGCMNGKHH